MRRAEEAATQTPAHSHLQEFQIFPSNWSEQHKLGKQRCIVSRPLSSTPKPHLDMTGQGSTLTLQLKQNLKWLKNNCFDVSGN